MTSILKPIFIYTDLLSFSQRVKRAMLSSICQALVVVVVHPGGSEWEWKSLVLAGFSIDGE